MSSSEKSQTARQGRESQIADVTFAGNKKHAGKKLNLVRWPGSGVAIEHARHPSDAKRVDNVGTTLFRP